MLVLVSCFAVGSFAADKKMRGTMIDLPEVTAEISGSVKKDDIEAAQLGGEKLTVEDTIKNSSTKKLVYLLVDTSTSMEQYTLNSIKPELIKYAQSINDGENKFVLITFGEKVKTVLKGGESNSKIKNAINDITCNAQNTTFYDALSKVYDMAQDEKDFDRKYALVVSDGADLDKGNNSQQEVVDNYKTHSLPVYAFCPYYAEKGSMDGFGYIARNSGGEFTSFSANNASDKFSSMQKNFENITLVKFKANSKKSNGTQELMIKVGDKKLTCQVRVTAKNDSKPPKIESTEYDKENNSIIITFSEPVENADRSSSFKVKKNGKELTILKAEYQNNKTSLFMQKTVYSGKYEFILTDITDASDNQNELEDPDYNETLEAVPVIWQILTIIGIALIPVVFLVAIYVVLLAVKKKKKVSRIRDIFVEQVEEEEHQEVHIKEKKGLALNLYIDSADGAYHQLTYNLISSVIVGRSDMCDIRIDDARMSNQHFVLETLPNGIAVTDLDSTNGTFVNGIKIGSRTLVRSGDRISAGNSAIRLVYQLQ